MKEPIVCDYLIIGAGIVGLSLAYELTNRFPEKHIVLIEKEDRVACHASGRNSGVLHAGFYYSSDSLKARLCVEGNRLMKEFCREHEIAVKRCGKIVVAANEAELEGLHELERRGKRNGVEVSLIGTDELARIEPNAKTHKQALYSPTTASVDPALVCEKLSEVLKKKGVRIHFAVRYLRRKGGLILTNRSDYQAKRLINAAGLYADKIARDFGFSKHRVILPFKGIYLQYNGNDLPCQTHIYPVPNLLNPFLGVHYTLTVHNRVNLGPTSIPAFWRENYSGFEGFKWGEFLQILYYEAKLFLFNSFNFRKLAIHEIRKYNRKHFVGLAKDLTHSCKANAFNEWLAPGIRAQLLNTETLKLEMDFLLEGDEHSLHILNAVSPAFTCSFAFARYIISEKLA
ncbi:L-2-hydroxyglutarate oxidase [Labilibaculum euxinus]|uniref:L-2-hydroxyglutarate oxidase n=1 Tax=Labilibaculum euxinus TaxID=2686357 RepID=A0A7M4D330_9BACT|nr:L-2-hydroxyglutarate oxidase [Labilibaculum euxinus]MUP37059.1 L-2-hydroxyglutarate oxidase [Labilibaculum euxinus]MVB06264.1 L-2-hydroxyglutarate oxidase [Labilibaculum euxinus]